MFLKKSNFSRNLKRLLEDTGMKQEALALETGISQSAISQMKNDKLIPGTDTLQKLADAFGTTSEKLTQGGNINGQAKHHMSQDDFFLKSEIIRYVDKLLEAKEETIRMQNVIIERQKQEIEKLMQAYKQ